MKSPNYKVKICIIGCGAIGSRMAKTIHEEFSKDCKITGLFDINPDRSNALANLLKITGVTDLSVDKLIKRCDVVVEAVNAPETKDLLTKALSNGKTVLAMSVGKVLNHPELFNLARKNKCYILLPSGAIAGVDAIKAASLAKIRKITLISRKPPNGFGANAYLQKKGINLSSIKKETVLYSGGVSQAVKNFPQNINVAATIALASQKIKNFKIKIVTSPKFRQNSHEVIMEGDFGKMTTRTENAVCPDNPKSSYLAVLSGLQTLKQFCTGIILVGT